ncbi:hypothetical protein WH47_08236 [Habropoda laboriosa]|uniref:Uncharacterized protein n=1 Tax=Habropoda laboriosa TaxID=597456 RepID=A0A0L7RGI7_9HYME|nr:hypothetical protein WH47_08236 [Habropoda laboriosa]
MIKINLMLYKTFKVNYIIQKQKNEKCETKLQTYSRLVHVTMTEKPNTVPDRISYIF